MSDADIDPRIRWGNRYVRDHVVRPAADGRDWCRITVNKADATEDTSAADVMLYDEIGFWGTTAQDFVRQVGALDVETLNVKINSPGGEVYDGIAIMNALRDHPATVNVTVDGLAASAASFIAMAGDTITMNHNSEMMIHDASGLVIGGPDDMAEFGAYLNKVSDNIASVYAERAGGTVADWRAVMKAETWYSAQEAVDAGLADRVAEAKSDEEKPSNRFDLSIFNYAGRGHAPAPANMHGSPSQSPAAADAGGKTQEGSMIVAFSDESIATLRQKLGIPEDADEGTILSALDEALNERAEPQNIATVEPLPEGVVTIDGTILDSLRADAEAGRQARTQQEREGRERIVDQAIQDGRIAPVRREAWLGRLAADPEEVNTLNSLEKGLVPVAEIGNTADEPPTDEAGYPAHWKR